MPANVVLMCAQSPGDSVDEERAALLRLFEDSGCEVTILIGINQQDITGKLKSFPERIDFLVYMGHKLRATTEALHELAEAIMLSGTACLVISSCDGVHFKEYLQINDYRGFVVFFKGSIYGDLAMELNLAFCNKVISDVEDYKTKNYKKAFRIVAVMYANMTDTGSAEEQLSDGNIGLCYCDENYDHETVYLPNAPRERRVLSLLE